MRAFKTGYTSYDFKEAADDWLDVVVQVVLVR